MSQVVQWPGVAYMKCETTVTFVQFSISNLLKFNV